MSPEDLAWLAGIIEGEGCIHITKTSSILLKVSMTDKDIVERVATLLDTHVTTKVRGAHYKVVYSARIWSIPAVAVIADLYQFFGERRRKKALEALEVFARTLQRVPRHCGDEASICIHGHPIRDSSDLYIYRGKSWCRGCRKDRAAKLQKVSKAVA
jgi:hypothetical protein